MARDKVTLELTLQEAAKVVVALEKVGNVFLMQSIEDAREGDRESSLQGGELGASYLALSKHIQDRLSIEGIK